MKKLISRLGSFFNSGFNAGKSLIAQKRLIYATTRSASQTPPEDLSTSEEPSGEKPTTIIDVKEFTRKQKEQLRDFQKETHVPVNVPPEADLKDAITELDNYLENEEIIGKMVNACMEHKIIFTFWTRFEKNPYLFPNRIKFILPPGSAAERLEQVTQNPDHPGYSLVVQFFQRLINKMEKYIKKSKDEKLGEFLNYSKEELMKVQTGSIPEKMRREKELKTRISEERQEIHAETQDEIKAFFENTDTLGLVYNRVNQNQYNFYEWNKKPTDPQVQRELLSILPKGPASAEFLNDLKAPETNQRNVKAKELLAFIVASLDKRQKKLEEHRELREKEEAGLYGPIKKSLKQLGKKFTDGTPGEKAAIAAAIGMVTYAFYKKWKESEHEGLKDLVRYGVVFIAGDYLVGKATGHSLADMANDSLLQKDRDKLEFAKSLEKLGFDKEDTELMKKASLISNVKASQLLPWYITASKTADKRTLDPRDVGIKPTLLKGEELFKIMHNIIAPEKGGMGIERFRKEFITNGDHSLAEIILRTYDKKKFDELVRNGDKELESLFKKYRIDVKTDGDVRKAEIFGGFLEDYDIVSRKGGGTIYKFPKLNEEILYNSGLPNEDAKNRAAIKNIKDKYRKQIDFILQKKNIPGGYDPDNLKFSGGKWLYESSVRGNAEYGVAGTDRYRIVVLPTRDGTDVSFVGATDIGETKSLENMGAMHEKAKIAQALEGSFDFMKLPTVPGSTEVFGLSFDADSIEETGLPGQIKATVKGTEVFATFDQATNTWKLDQIGAITPEFAKEKSELLKKNKRWYEAFETLGLGIDNAPEEHWPSDWWQVLDVKPSGTVIGEYYQQLVRNKRDELIKTYETELAKIEPPDVLQKIKDLEDRVIRKAYTHVKVRNAQLSERIAELSGDKKEMQAAEFEQFCREFEEIGVHDDFYPFLLEFRNVVYGGKSGFNLEGFDRSDFSEVNHQVYFILKDSFMKYVGKFSDQPLEGSGTITVDGKTYSKEHVRKYIYWVQIQYQNWLNRLMTEPYPKGFYGKAKDLWGLWKKVKLPEVRAYIDDFEGGLESIDTFISSGGPARMAYPNGGKIPPITDAYKAHKKPEEAAQGSRRVPPATGLPRGGGGAPAGGPSTGPSAGPSSGISPTDPDAFLAQPEFIDKGGAVSSKAEIASALKDVNQAFFNKFKADPDYDFSEINRVYNILDAGSVQTAGKVDAAANRKDEFDKNIKKIESLYLLYTLNEIKANHDKIKKCIDAIDDSSDVAKIKTELLKALNFQKKIFTNVKLNKFFDRAAVMNVYRNFSNQLDTNSNSIFNGPKYVPPKSKKASFKLFTDAFKKTFYSSAKKF